MPRAHRFDPPGSWHHVMNRGAGRRLVFGDDEDRQVFLRRVGEVECRFGVEVHAFCLMGNHFHLLVRSIDGELSGAMKWIGQQFTQHVNTRRGVDGAIFRGRFHSVRVQEESHLIWLFRYVNANPLELGWTKPLVMYPWSGLAQTVRLRNDQPWLNTGFCDEHFGKSDRLVRFVEEARMHGDVPRTGVGVHDVPSPPADPGSVADAARICRAPGPHAHSNADVEAVSVLVAIRLGFDRSQIPGVAHLDAMRAGEAIRRLEKRVTERNDLARFEERVLSVLQLIRRRDQPDAIAGRPEIGV